MFPYFNNHLEGLKQNQPPPPPKKPKKNPKNQQTNKTP